MIEEREYKSALEWLADNTDKWERDPEFKWLIPNPEEVAPGYVFAYLKQKKEDEEYWDSVFDMFDTMGLNDF